MKFRRQGPLFPESFRLRPCVILTQNVGDRMYGARKGSTVAIEMYATAPVGAEVWLRHDIRYSSTGRDNGRAGFQCLARVTGSVVTERGWGTRSTKYRTTFVLIGEPDRSNH